MLLKDQWPSPFITAPSFLFMLYCDFALLAAVGWWFPPGTPVSSTRKLISSSSSFHRLDMTLAVAEALNPNKPINQPIALLAAIATFTAVK